MTEGREVVDDYRSKGLTLRRHPLSFLRGELTGRRASNPARNCTVPGMDRGSRWQA